MTRLVSRFGKVNVIRCDRPLTHDELFRVVPSVLVKISMSHEVTVIPIFRQLPYWIT